MIAVNYAIHYMETHWIDHGDAVGDWIWVRHEQYTSSLTGDNPLKGPSGDCTWEQAIYAEGTHCLYYYRSGDGYYYSGDGAIPIAPAMKTLEEYQSAVWNVIRGSSRDTSRSYSDEVLKNYLDKNVGVNGYWYEYKIAIPDSDQVQAVMFVVRHEIDETTSEESYCTVRYHANGEGVQGVPSDQTYPTGTEGNLSSQVPTRDRYVFQSWNTSSDGGGITYNPGQAHTWQVDLDLYAIWKPKKDIGVPGAGGGLYGGKIADDKTVAGGGSGYINTQIATGETVRGDQNIVPVPDQSNDGYARITLERYSDD